MKNLANCSPIEFLRQTNKIRHSVEKWLKDTKILEIRKNKPKLIEIKNDMTAEEKEKANAENIKRINKQAKENISKMLDLALDTHAEETLEVLALMCFVEPDKINDYKPTVYLNEFAQMIADEDVINFFTSLMRLEQIGIFSIARK